MFKLLKNKFRDVVKTFSKKTDDALQEQPAAEEQQKFEEKIGDFVEEKEQTPVTGKEPAPYYPEVAETKETPSTKTPAAPTIAPSPFTASAPEKKSLLGKVSGRFRTQPGEPKKGIFRKVTEAVTTTRLSPEKFDDIFWDMEVILLENNVAGEVIEKIKDDLKAHLVDKPLRRGHIEQEIMRTLRTSIEELFVAEPINFLGSIRSKKPYIIMFVGINGSGKTTTIAKMAKMLLGHELHPVIAAADTFRAAAIQQLQVHADSLGVKLIKQDYGADPAAVAYDTIAYAKAHNADVVLIDTAGRLHSNVNLIEEMKKMNRVAKPDLTLFIGESITGNDCVEQAKSFNEAIGIDGIILSKADVDEKGGAAISVSFVTKKPILYLGTGQGYGDLTPFNPGIIVESLGLKA
jgi:fused signal recognition particle receptor